MLHRRSASTGHHGAGRPTPRSSRDPTRPVSELPDLGRRPACRAVATLMKDLNPSLTPDTTYAALKTTAIDMDDPSTAGFDAGFDFGTGFGLIQADAALNEVVPPPPVFCNGLRTTLVGTGANDNLVGTPVDDVIHGLGGNDIISGLGGNDVICGGPGRDRLSGNQGRDRLFGDAGRDNLRGGSGNDRLFGRSGNDALDGQSGSDRCNGGSGTDTPL